MVAKHPEVQQRMREEIQSVIGDRDPTTEDLEKLKYCSAVLSETSRIYPVAFNVGRELAEDMQIGKYLIPKGTTVDVPVIALNRNEKYWKNPMTFDPERWISGETSTLFNFGGGPRLCIGRHFARNIQMPMITALLIRKFTLSINPASDPVEEQVITLHPKKLVLNIQKI